MIKKSYRRPLAILIAVIGAYHIVLFALHPKLPPVDKAEVIVGKLSEQQPATPVLSQTQAALCSKAEHTLIDEKKGESNIGDITSVRFEYRPLASTFVNTGDAAQILMARGSSITIGDKNYRLKKIRFERSDSNGHRLIHLIHKQTNGRIVVISIPVKVSDKENSAIVELWRYLPKQQGDHNALDDLHLDLGQLLPHDRSFYRYTKADDCNGNAVILGLTTPVQISAKQLAKLDKVLAEHTATRSF